MGALAQIDDEGSLYMDARVTAPDGGEVLRESARRDSEACEAIGARLAALLVERGASRIMRGISTASTA